MTSDSGSTLIPESGLGQPAVSNLDQVRSPTQSVVPSEPSNPDNRRSQAGPIRRAMASLALLQVTWDRHQKDFLEHFVPLVAEVVRSGEDNVVSLGSVQFGLQKQFGLQVPQHAIKLLLNRLSRKQLLTRDHGVYIRNLGKLDQVRFTDLRAEIIEKHDRLVQSLLRFAERELQVSWAVAEAEKALASYLQMNSFDIAIGYNGSIMPPVEEAPDASQFVVAKFVERLFQERTADLDALMAIIKGQMLASALFLPDPSQVGRKFKGTQIFFDTRFLLSTLGYHGDLRRTPCRELLELLVESGAQLRCFRHTLREMQGAVHSAALMMRKGRTGRAYGSAVETIAYFTDKGYPPADVELRAAALERDLAALHVEVVDSPGWEATYVIDEPGLATAIKSRIKYFNAGAVDRDVASISSVMRLRRGRRSDALETCNAVFITDNVTLVQVCRDFLNESGASPVLVPAAITDYTLTTLLWLKRPTAAPNLPMRTLAATCYAATQPDETLWRRYLDRVQQMEREGTVTPDDYYLARYTYSARSILMERTLGGTDVFTEGTVTDILNRIKVDIAGEQAAKLEATRAEVAAYARNQELSSARHRHIAHRVAHGVSRALAISLGLLFGVGVVLSSGLVEWEPLKHGTPRVVVYVAAAAVAGLTYLATWSGFAFAPFLRRLELRLEHRIFAGLHSLSEPVPTNAL